MATTRTTARTTTEAPATVSVRAVLVVGVVLLALAVAFLLGRGEPVAQAAPATVTASTADDEAVKPRTLTMRGEGDATVVPDQAAYDVTVKVVRDDLETALGSASTTLDRILGRLEALGIAKSDVETTGLQTSPVYERVRGVPPRLTGYRVTQSVTVLVKRLGRAGKAISTTVDAGGDAVTVGDIQLRVGDPEAGLAKARAEAVKAATAKATQYAEATGQTLGDVETLVEVDPSRYDGVRLTRAAAYSFDSVESFDQSMPIRAGRTDLSVTVEVVWRLA